MTLVVYGCSFVLSGDLDNGFKTDDSFAQLTAQRLGLGYDNRGDAGTSNFIIFLNILQDLYYLRSNASICYVNWSFIDRLTILDDYKRYYSLLPSDAFQHNPHTASIIRQSEIETLYKYTYDNDKNFVELLSYCATLVNLLSNLHFVFSVTGMRQHENEITYHLVELIKKLPGYMNLDINDFITSNEKQRTPCRHLNKQGHEIFSKFLFDAINMTISQEQARL